MVQSLVLKKKEEERREDGTERGRERKEEKERGKGKKGRGRREKREGRKGGKEKEEGQRREEGRTDRRTGGREDRWTGLVLFFLHLRPFFIPLPLCADPQCCMGDLRARPAPPAHSVLSPSLRIPSLAKGNSSFLTVRTFHGSGPPPFPSSRSAAADLVWLPLQPCNPHVCLGLAI